MRGAVVVAYGCDSCAVEGVVEDVAVITRLVFLARVVDVKLTAHRPTFLSVRPYS